MIREAKGIPVLAHPFTLNLGSAYALKNLVIELKGLGLAGLEVFYSEHTREQEALYLKLARELDLLVTGGSDYHGQNKPEITLGSMPCQDRLTYNLVTALKAGAAGNIGWTGESPPGLTSCPADTWHHVGLNNSPFPGGRELGGGG